jgi:hypothetical protein
MPVSSTTMHHNAPCHVGRASGGVAWLSLTLNLNIDVVAHEREFVNTIQ